MSHYIVIFLKISIMLLYNVISIAISIMPLYIIMYFHYVTLQCSLIMIIKVNLYRAIEQFWQCNF